MRTTNKDKMNVSTSAVSGLTLLLSVVVFLFYLSIQAWMTNVYQYAIVGAVFELLSVPMLLLLVAIPVLCVVQLRKPKGPGRKYIFASILFFASTIIVLTQTS